MKTINFIRHDIPEPSELEKAANLLRWAKFAYENTPPNFTNKFLQNFRLKKYWELANDYVEALEAEKIRAEIVKILLRNEIEFEIKNGRLFI